MHLFHVLKNLINLVPVKDNAVMDIVEHIMEPVQMIVEKVTEYPDITVPELCLGNFPTKTIVDQEDGMIVS